MARHWKGEIRTLRDAVCARRLLWGLCRHCGHAARLDPRSLAFRYGALDLATVGARLRCRRCTQQRGAIVVNDQEWADMR